ncbi:MAG: helix-turn-helix domain-containing protein [Armatimonadetes bacterium]|nr:helix-turn-helix domain-containing protein [Armatimonadota bacterium]
MTNWDDAPVVMTLEQAAKILNRPYRTVLGLCHQRGFPARRLGKRWMVSRDGLRLWVKENFITK